MKTTIWNGTATPKARQVGLLATVVCGIRRWHELGRQRSQLAKLDARTLKDLGISHAEARQEARRWFWDDPQA